MYRGAPLSVGNFNFPFVVSEQSGGNNGWETV